VRRLWAWRRAPRTVVRLDFTVRTVRSTRTRTRTGAAPCRTRIVASKSKIFAGERERHCHG
jgi:hypothetical protein